MKPNVELPSLSSFEAILGNHFENKLMDAFCRCRVMFDAY